MYVTSQHFYRKDQWIIFKINIFAISSEKPITTDNTVHVTLSSFTLLDDTLGASTNEATRPSSMTAHAIPSIPVSQVLCAFYVRQSVLENCGNYESAIKRILCD